MQVHLCQQVRVQVFALDIRHFIYSQARAPAFNLDSIIGTELFQSILIKPNEDVFNSPVFAGDIAPGALGIAAAYCGGVAYTGQSVEAAVF